MRLLTFLPTALAAATPLVRRQANSGLPEDQCLTPGFAVSTGAGSSEGGVAFCASKQGEGFLINRIEAKADSESLAYVEIEFTDGHTISFGDDRGDREGEVRWDPEVDEVEEVIIWDGGSNGDTHDGNAVAGIVIELSSGASMEVKSDYAEGSGIKLDTGRAGLLLGMHGRHGGSSQEMDGHPGCIDRLDFVFSKRKIKSKRIDNLKYTPDPEDINELGTNEDRGFSIKSYDAVEFQNELSNDAGIRFQVQQSETNTKQWTSTLSNMFGMSAGMEVSTSWGMPELIGGELSFSTEMKWEITKTSSEMTGESETVGRTLWLEPTVKPGEAIRCIAWAFEGRQMDITYEGEAIIELEPANDGSDTEWRYPVSGKYEDIRFTEMQASCKKIDPKDMGDDDAREPDEDEILDPDETSGGTEDENVVKEVEQ